MEALQSFVINVDLIADQPGHFMVDIDSLKNNGCPQLEIGELNGLIGALNSGTGKFEFNMTSRAIIADRLESCGMQDTEVEQTITDLQDSVTHLVIC